MLFLSQPPTLLILHNRPNQHLLRIRDIRLFLQLVCRPARGMPVRREGLRTIVLITQYVHIVIYLTSIR